MPSSPTWWPWTSPHECRQEGGVACLARYLLPVCTFRFRIFVLKKEEALPSLEPPWATAPTLPDLRIAASYTNTDSQALPQSVCFRRSGVGDGNVFAHHR